MTTVQQKETKTIYQQLTRGHLRGRLKSTTYFVAITQTSFQRTSSTPPFGLSLNASYLALFKRPLKYAILQMLRNLGNSVHQFNVSKFNILRFGGIL